MLAPGGAYMVISFRKPELLVPLLSCAQLGWTVTHTPLPMPDGQAPASLCTMRRAAIDADGGAGEAAAGAAAASVSGAPDVDAVTRHIEELVDQWYREESPLLTAAREQALRQDWAAALRSRAAAAADAADAVGPSAADGALPLADAWAVMLTADERTELTLDEFAEDAAAFVEHAPASPPAEAPPAMPTISLARALAYLHEQQ
jgi:hypothetical protein